LSYYKLHKLKFKELKGYTPIEFGHLLTDLAAGFVITNLYEDAMTDSPLGKYHPNYIATRAVKM